MRCRAVAAPSPMNVQAAHAASRLWIVVEWRAKLAAF
jgi:hypothetical protein